ncbi:MAG: hypothetical protein K8L97_08400 [Anaerolineae bacterium]|nr:hypothetical protein [Anaerolineae bacterium]
MGDDLRRAELLERIQILLRSFPDEIVEELVEQWEQELEELFKGDANNVNLDTSSDLLDNEV